MDWKNAEPDDIVCWCRKVDKASVVKSILAGADSVEKVGDACGAGNGSECAVKNPSGKCCHGDIRKLIEIYGSPLCPPEPRAPGTGCCS